MIKFNRHYAENFITGAPLVSVIIPVYNVSRYLPDCIESVINQTYQNIEIVIIDDGSTDGSGRICERYAEMDSRICVIHSDNRGLASARNLGLENAKGLFISFIDSDDWMEPHTIETLVRAAAESKADIVKARHCGEYVDETLHPVISTEEAHIYCNQDILSAFAEGLFDHLAWNKLYRAECFDSVRYPDGQNYEDVSTTWKIMKKLAENGGTVTSLPDELFHFRARKSSITHTRSYKNIIDCWTAYHSLYEALPDYREKFLGGCFNPIGYMWMSFCRFSAEDREKAVATVREMNAFSREHFQRVMKGKYSRFIKLSCLISQSMSPAAMWIGYYGRGIRRVFRSKKHVMFE